MGRGSGTHGSGPACVRHTLQVADTGLAPFGAPRRSIRKRKPARDACRIGKSGKYSRPHLPYRQGLR